MEEFLSTPFTQPFYFFQLTAIIFGITFIRYLVVSGVYHSIFYVWLKGAFAGRIINGSNKDRRQMWMEVYRSALTSGIFAFSGTALVIFWQKGWTQIYTDWQAFPIWYHPLALVLALLLHETYYYWLHRWMHRPKVYRWVHKWHHDSIETSSLTSFSFHPVESILQAVVVPILILVVPMHLYTLFLLLIIMTLSGTINHAGVEVFPKGFERHWLGKWLIGATHHDLHHKQFRYNFGLYFTFWDHWMNTESPRYEATFREKTGDFNQNSN
ncbi:MAG: sterol desaturase family protein [Saprospiraceae bacterium]